MIKILDRYIAKSIIMATLVAMMIIAAISLLISSLAELKNIGEGDYGFLQALIFVFMRLPNEIYHFSPLLILLGCIIGLSVLSSSRELAVMRASGFSIQRIILSVLVSAFVLILMISTIGESLAPFLSYKAAIHKEYAKNSGQAVITSSGMWLHVDNNFIHIQHVIGRQLLEGVTRYEFDNEHRLKAAYFADTLTFKNHQWHMFDGVKTLFSKNHTQSESFTQAEWNVKFNPNLLSVGIEPKEMSLRELARFARYLKQNGVLAAEYQYEFWQRVFQPLASLVMIFLAIPFVLRTLSTATIGWRILVGILVGFAFFILNALLGQLCIVYQLPAVFSASLPFILFAVLGFLFCKRFAKNA